MAEYKYDADTDKWFLGDMAADFIYAGSNKIDFPLPQNLKILYDAEYWNTLENKASGHLCLL